MMATVRLMRRVSVRFSFEAFLSGEISEIRLHVHTWPESRFGAILFKEHLFFCKVIIVLYFSEYGEVLACKYLSFFEAQ